MVSMSPTSDSTALDIPVPVRWTDLDAYGHVNNAAMVRLLEEARIAAFWQPDPEQLELGAEIATVIASQRIEYVRQLGHRRDGVVVRLWLSRIGGASLTVDYLVLTRDDPEGRAPYARARTVVVLVDTEDGTPVRLAPEARISLQAHAGEPLTFRG